MVRIFRSPAKYVQGPYIVADAATYLRPLGRHFLLLTDTFIWESIGKQIVATLEEGDLTISVKQVTDDITTTIKQVDAIIGLGGGSVIDLAKTISHHYHLPIALIPTTASTDAATSAISVLYDENNIFQAYRFYPKHPDLILVDTAIINKAPAHFLAFGIADALATFIEVQAVVASDGQNLVGGKPTLAAVAIAEKCQQIIMEKGLRAYNDNKKQRLTMDFEDVVEANILLSGLGFENGGLAAAHALHNSFSVLKGKIHTVPHGAKIAFTTLVQLVLEERPTNELMRYIQLYRMLNLPTSLTELFLTDITYQDLLNVGKQTLIETETMKNMPFAVTSEMIADAILAVDEYTKITH